jgi:hypothetical protein
MFNNSLVMYSLVLVNGEEMLVEEVKKFLDDADFIHTLFFINCGAKIDFSKNFEIPEDIIIVIIDHHRPFNLESTMEEKLNV